MKLLSILSTFPPKNLLLKEAQAEFKATKDPLITQYNTGCKCKLDKLGKNYLR